MAEIGAKFRTLEYFYGISETLRKPDSSSTAIKHEKIIARSGEVADVAPILTALGIDVITLPEPEEEATGIRRVVESMRTPLTVAIASLTHL